MRRVVQSFDQHRAAVPSNASYFFHRAITDHQSVPAFAAVECIDEAERWLQIVPTEIGRLHRHPRVVLRDRDGRAPAASRGSGRTGARGLGLGYPAPREIRSL